MKYVGLLILAVGVGLAASYGARVTPDVEQQLTLAGAAQFRGAETDAAFEAYCKARADAALEMADGCPLEGEAPPAPPASTEDEEEERAPPTQEELVASGRARLESMRTTEEVLTGDVLTTREAWLAAFEQNIEPSAAAAVARTPRPEERLAAWAESSGLMFALGLLLIVVGAVIGRVAVKREASREPAAAEGATGKDAKDARDFGKVLDRLRDEVRGLAEQARGIVEPQRADYDRVKNEIDRLEAEHIEPLVAARARVQVKHGMAGFAEIFGPLSSAERKLHRAWSASVDRHWPETQASLDAAAADLVEAHDVLTRISSGAQPRS